MMIVISIFCELNVTASFNLHSKYSSMSNLYYITNSIAILSQPHQYDVEMVYPQWISQIFYKIDYYSSYHSLNLYHNLNFVFHKNLSIIMTYYLV